MVRWAMVCCTVLSGFSSAAGEVEAPAQFHDDYYEGFAQGVYYGLLLGGEPYDAAWCMKAELGYEAKSLGGGGDFQRTLEQLLAQCRASSAAAEPSP